MTITAEAVRQLRERTGAGMMECKRALVETRGDLDAAAELMRRNGLAKADKKAARIAAEGTLVIERNGQQAVLVEVNFVSNPTLEKGMLGAPDYARRAARGLRQGLEEFLRAMPQP